MSIVVGRVRIRGTLVPLYRLYSSSTLCLSMRVNVVTGGLEDVVAGCG